MAGYKIHKFPATRIATIDIGAIGRGKHHIAALLELDVSSGREKIKQLKKQGRKISFTAWLISVIGHTVKEHGQVAAFLSGKQTIIQFDDINISVIVEKTIDGRKVPVPLIIEKAGERSIVSIAELIHQARNKQITEKDIVLLRKAGPMERIYYRLPGFLRRFFWQYLLKHPKWAFGRMGNVSVTSVGMMGNANGWFIPFAVHPVSFGIGKISKKPVVKQDRIEIREILNMTVLLDHDVIDGAPMARFISDLTNNIEIASGL